MSFYDYTFGLCIPQIWTIEREDTHSGGFRDIRYIQRRQMIWLAEKDCGGGRMISYKGNQASGTERYGQWTQYQQDAGHPSRR
jgi:hypothetical protein